LKFIAVLYLFGSSQARNKYNACLKTNAVSFCEAKTGLRVSAKLKSFQAGIAIENPE
jgi:hypothetical protein